MIDSSPYELKDFPGSSHWLLIRAVRRQPVSEGVLLDIGAAGGEISRLLEHDFSKRIGIEGDPARVEALSAAFDSAFIADLTQLRKLPKADVIILADIIEHLPRPGSLLELVREAVSAQGRVLISVPNVANITIRASLLTGRWNYQDRGILDRTHLRFYTKQTLIRELRDAGLESVRVESTTMPVRLVLEGRLPAFLVRLAEQILLRMTPLMPGLLGYQWVVTARPSRR